MHTVTHTQTWPYAAWLEIQDSWRCQTQTRLRQDISHSQKSTYAVSWDAVTSSRLDCRAHTHRQTPNLLLTWSFLRSPQKGRWEQRERMRLPEHCGCGSSWKSLQGERGEGRCAWGLAGGWGQVLCQQDVPWTPQSQGSSEHQPQWPQRLPAVLQGTGPLWVPGAPCQKGAEAACLLTALPEANSLLLEGSHGKSKH